MGKGGLGRGLSALLPSLGIDADLELLDLPLDRIEPNASQPRKTFDQRAIDELVESIKQFGVVQPIVVRPKGEDYELIAGERRWRAAGRAGLSSIRAVVREVSDREALQLALIENIQREELNAVEEAEAYQQLIAEYAMTQAELASRLGKSRSAITNTLRLLGLPHSIKRAIVEGEITSGHARSLLSLPEEEVQLRLAEQIREQKLSVRDAEQLVREEKERERDADMPQESSQTNKPPAAMKELARDLSQRLQVKVSVLPRASGGQIRISYGSLPELARLIQTLQQGAETVREPEFTHSGPSTL